MTESEALDRAVQLANSGSSVIVKPGEDGYDEIKATYPQLMSGAEDVAVRVFTSREGKRLMWSRVRVWLGSQERVEDRFCGDAELVALLEVD